MKKRWNIIAILLIIIFAIGITEKTLQNDTYYYIAVGKQIVENGIDMKDHFSIHEDLKYVYPHWAFDVFTYIVYSIGEFDGIYIMTILFMALLGVTLYLLLVKQKHSKIISLFSALSVMLMMTPFISARSQSLSYILFIMEIYAIEKFLENKKKKYIILLFIIGIIIANMHVAVWWMFFILFLPYIGEYIITFLSLEESKKRKLKRYTDKINKIKRGDYSRRTVEKYEEEIENIKEYLERKKSDPIREPYKIKAERNNNVKALIRSYDFMSCHRNVYTYWRYTIYVLN